MKGSWISLQHRLQRIFIVYHNGLVSVGQHGAGMVLMISVQSVQRTRGILSGLISMSPNSLVHLIN